MFYPGDKIRPWLSFLLVFGRFVAIFMFAQLNVFNSGKLTMISSRFPEAQWNSNVSCLTLSRRHEFSAKQTTNQTSVFIRKQRSLCILLHPQARIFRCVKFSKLIPTVKPMGKEVLTSRKSLVKLPKFMYNERDLSPVKYHNRIKRHLLPRPSLPEYPVTPVKM